MAEGVFGIVEEHPHDPVVNQRPEVIHRGHRKERDCIADGKVLPLRLGKRPRSEAGNVIDVDLEGRDVF